MSRFIMCLSIAALAACGSNEKIDLIEPTPPQRADCALSLFGDLRDADLLEQDPETRAASIREVVSGDPLFRELQPEQQETVIQGAIVSYDECLASVGGGAGQGPCKNAQSDFPLCRNDACNAVTCTIDCCQAAGHGSAVKCASTMCCDDYTGGSSRPGYACVSK